jgi:hypothetical protein
VPGSTHALWRCRCDCGRTVDAKSYWLRHGIIKRCKACRVVDLTGQQFGRLVVIRLNRKTRSQLNTKAYWLCRCDCGTEITTRTDYLRSGRTKSCGCWLHSPRLPDRGSAWNQVLSKLKIGAQSRGITWSLTKEQAFLIVRRNCHYCNAPPAHPRVGGANQKVLYTGIDRINSARGYTPRNVVPCCAQCNFAKHTMSVAQFKAWISRVHAHFVLSR